MAARKTTSILRVLVLILPFFLLTSCSNPDTSGGVTLSRGGGDDANEFPNGSCEGQHENTPDLNTGCGWIHINDKSYYIMPEADLRDANLRGANLSGADLRVADLIGANLSGADLSGANLRGANLNNASLRGVKANSSTVCPNTKRWGTEGNDCGFNDNDKDFPYGSCESQGNNPPGDRTGCGWVHVNSNSYYIMPDADLSRADLSRADLSGANLRGANLRDADLIRAELSRADLSGANLRGANLLDANLRDADLRDANLRGANLNRANLIGANLRDASLSGVKADSSTVCPNTKRWRTAGNDCGFYDIYNDFPNGSCVSQYATTPHLNSGCGWIYNSVRQGYYIQPEANLRGANLSGADLSGANLRDAYLRDADLSGANLRDANLNNAGLRGVKANSFTVCPNTKRWGTEGNDCGF